MRNIFDYYPGTPQKSKLKKNFIEVFSCPNRRFLGNYLSKRQAGRVLAKSLLRGPVCEHVRRHCLIVCILLFAAFQGGVGGGQRPIRPTGARGPQGGAAQQIPAANQAAVNARPITGQQPTQAQRVAGNNDYN